MKQKFTMPDGEIIEKEWPHWKTPNNHDTNFESDRTGLYCADPSLTKQEFKEEADINNIINRFLRTGEPPPMPLPEHFMDLTGRTTYFDMQQQIATANEAFYKLNATQRAEHLNDPQRWADAVVKAVEKGDRQQIRHLGLDAPEPEPKPPTVEPPPVAPTKTEGAPSAPKGP